jgi:repressor LexA
MRHIQDALDRTGIAPSYQELMDGLGLRSKAHIWRLIHDLMERGYLRQLPYRRRSLQVIRRVPVEIPDPVYVMSADLAERRGQ